MIIHYTRWQTIIEPTYTDEGTKERTCEICGDKEKESIPVLELISMKDATISGIVAKTFTGKAITQNPIVTIGSTTLKSGVDYTLSYSNNINAGTATMIIKGKGIYTDNISKAFKINKAANPLTIKAKTTTVKYSKIKKKAQTLAITKVVTFTKKGQGTISYECAGVNKAKFKKSFKINAKTGKISIKKGLKKGSYKVKVKI